MVLFAENTNKTLRALSLFYIKDEEFLILPHLEVKKHFHKKATDYQRWLSGMNKIKKKALSKYGDLSIKSIIKSL